MSTLRRQQGFSLVELMITLVLGTLVSGAIMQMFLSNNHALELQRAAISLQEEGRAALDYITRYARMAGFRETDLEKGRLPDGLTGTADSITVKFKAGKTASGSPTDPVPVTWLRDCVGTKVSNAAESTNTFLVSGGELICQATTAGTTASAALISNVRELSIRYGVDTDDDGVANQYKTTPGSDEVVTLKICLRLRSEDNLVEPAVKYRKCDGSVEDTASTNLERRIETTVTLRNRAEG